MFNKQRNRTKFKGIVSAVLITVSLFAFAAAANAMPYYRGEYIGGYYYYIWGYDIPDPAAVVWYQPYIENSALGMAMGYNARVLNSNYSLGFWNQR